MKMRVMLALALTLHLASIDPSSAALSQTSRVRLVQIDRELKGLKDLWPTGSIVLMSVGFGSTLLFGLGGLALLGTGNLGGIILGAFSVIIAGVALLVGIAGLIWGAVAAATNGPRRERLESERALLLNQVRDDEALPPPPEQLPPPPQRPQVLAPTPLMTVAVF